MSIDRDQDTKAPDMPFINSDLAGVQFPHDNPLVVSLKISRYIVKRNLVDGGCSADILFLSTFKKIGLVRKDLTPASFPVVGLQPKGIITLLVRVGQGPTARNLDIDFLVVDMPSPHNALVGHPLIHRIRGVPNHALPDR